MPEMLTVVAHVRAKSGKEDEVRQGLRALLAPTRREEGCINYDMHESTETPGQFVFYENWTSRALLDAHLASAHIRTFFARIPELLAEQPRITFWRRVD
ncbi:MAG: antibiotic biosynthesis monooxygenase [Acidobacteria bacterium]|nr:antibiotic biosynthesis monooxygenase [Acidobacteriota bacterium]